MNEQEGEGTERPGEAGLGEAEVWVGWAEALGWGRAQPVWLKFLQLGGG